MPDQITIGKLFALAREMKGLSLQQAAMRTGVSKPCIHQIEHDKSKDVAFRIIVKLADFYSLKLDRIADCLRAT